jgi:hypothetical protein
VPEGGRRGAFARSPRTRDPERAPAPVPVARTRRDGPKLSNPDKVLFPRDGITKRQIWDYYTAVAPVMLPHLAGRPLTLQRYPDGIDGEEWYQHNVPLKAPPFVRLVDVGAAARRQEAHRLRFARHAPVAGEPRRAHDPHLVQPRPARRRRRARPSTTRWPSPTT